MENLVRIISFILGCCIFSSCTHESIDYTKCETAVDSFDFTKEGFQVGPVICGRDTHQYAFFHKYGISSFAHWESCKYCCKEVEEPKKEIKLEKDDKENNGKADTCKRSN